MRLLARGGRLNVDAELDRLDPRQFDEWVAFEQLEPDPLDRIREVLKLGFATLAGVSGFGARIEPDELDPVTRDQSKSKLMSPEQAAETLRGVYGF